jgi:5-methylcytosine-specific restriction endonuclease McrA
VIRGGKSAIRAAVNGYSATVVASGIVRFVENRIDIRRTANRVLSDCVGTGDCVYADEVREEMTYDQFMEKINSDYREFQQRCDEELSRFTCAAEIEADIVRMQRERISMRIEHEARMKRRSRQYNRRSVLSLAGGYHSKAQWLALCDLYNNQCVACGAAAALTRDHVIPLSKGGTNDIGNIQPLCQPCNNKKFTQIIDYRTLVLPS